MDLVAIFVPLHRGQSEGTSEFSRRMKRKCPKLQSNWEDPYLITYRLYELICRYLLP